MNVKIEDPVNDETSGELSWLLVVAFVRLDIEYGETESLEVSLIGSSPKVTFSSSA